MIATHFIPSAWVEKAAWNPGLVVHSFQASINRRAVMPRRVHVADRRAA